MSYVVVTETTLPEGSTINSAEDFFALRNTFLSAEEIAEIDAYRALDPSSKVVSIENNKWIVERTYSSQQEYTDYIASKPTEYLDAVGKLADFGYTKSYTPQ